MSFREKEVNRRHKGRELKESCLESGKGGVYDNGLLFPQYTDSKTVQA